MGDSGEDPAEGGAEVARGEVIAEEERRYVFTGLFCGLGLRFLLGVEVAEMQVAGAARSAALAAIGKCESTQTGTVLLMCDRSAVFFLCGRRAIFFKRDRKAVDGAFRGHGSLLK